MSKFNTVIDEIILIIDEKCPFENKEIILSEIKSIKNNNESLYDKIISLSVIISTNFDLSNSEWEKEIKKCFI